jgi:hypothetical protein
MFEWMRAYKPAAPARVHLLLAAVLWSVVGGVMLAFGVKWLAAWRSGYVWAVLAAALIVGLVKARFVLRPSADRIVTRIRERGDGRCLGGFLSPKTWLFVLLMIAAGRVLRSGLLPSAAAGFIYAAVGAALLWASRRLWRAWRHFGGAG